MGSSSICFLNAGATIGSIVVSGLSQAGRFIVDRIGLGIFGGGGSSMTTSWLEVFSGSGGFTLECLAMVHPLMFRNSVKSTLFLLQQLQPLYAS